MSANSITLSVAVIHEAKGALSIKVVFDFFYPDHSGSVTDICTRKIGGQRCWLKIPKVLSSRLSD